MAYLVNALIEEKSPDVKTNAYSGIRTPCPRWAGPIFVQKLLTALVMAVCIGSIYLYNDALAKTSLERDERAWRNQLAYLDGEYYLHLAKVWYSAGDKECAFYPLWPWLIKTSSNLLRVDPVIAALLLSSGFSAFGMILFYGLVEKKAGEQIALNSLILVLAFPGAIFFSLLYSESLFFFLSMLFFRGLLGRKVWLVSISCFFLPMTRAIGIFILFPLAYDLLNVGWCRWRSETSLASASKVFNSEKKRTLGAKGDIKAAQQAVELSLFRRPLRLLACIVTQPLWLGAIALLAGYASYFAIMCVATGNPFEGFTAQRQFPPKASVSNIFHIGHFFRSLLDVGAVHGMLDSLIDRIFFLLFLGTLPSIWRLDRRYFFYALGTGLIPALSNGLMSYTRFVELCFPMYIVLAIWLAGPTRRLFLWYYVGVVGITQAVFLVRSLTFHWAG